MSTRRRVLEELFYYYDSQCFEDVIILMSKQEFEDILIKYRDPNESPAEWQSFGDIKFMFFDDEGIRLAIEYPCRFMSEVQDSIYEAYLYEVLKDLADLLQSEG